MVTFEDFFKDLCSNYVWFQPATMHHKPETFRSVANKVYMQYVASESFPPIQEARRHVYNKLVLIPGDKVKKDWYKTEEQKKEAEKAKEWVPLNGEARQAKLKEWMDSVSKVEMVSAVPKLTVKQIIEQGDWRAVATIAPRSEVEKHIIIETHIEKVNTARRKMFLSAFPDASEEEIQAYIRKFDVL